MGRLRLTIAPSQACSELRSVSRECEDCLVHFQSAIEYPADSAPHAASPGTTIVTELTGLHPPDIAVKTRCYAHQVAYIWGVRHEPLSHRPDFVSVGFPRLGRRSSTHPNPLMPSQVPLFNPTLLRSSWRLCCTETHRLFFACVVLFVATLSSSAHAEEESVVTRALFDYVNGQDSFVPTYEKRFESSQKGLDIRLYTVHSQVWQGHDLYNQMYTAIPTGIDPSEVKHVLLIITGGSFRSRLYDPPTDSELKRFIKKARRYASIINRLNTAAVVVRHVPFQRMKLCEGGHPRGQSEDALIACTLQKYLETGDPSWPLLFPMTKTVKVNMDIAEEIFREEWGAQIKSFTVLGASKRGWTAHMISIVDDRVTATIPIVINMLNMPEYIKHSLRVWGTHSPQIRDYSDLGILQEIDSPRGKQMFAMIDPYTYREFLDKPKLLVYGTNDPYWPVDSTRHYVADLPGETHLLFIPNQGHKSTRSGISLLIAASKAMHQSASTGKRLAPLDWKYTNRAGALNITIETDIKPMKIEYWSSTSRDRDFRDNKWRKKVLCGGRNIFPWTWFTRSCEEKTITDVPIPTDSCRAQFAQVYFEHDDFKRYPISTDISVTGPVRCITTLEPEKSPEIARIKSMPHTAGVLRDSGGVGQ